MTAIKGVAKPTTRRRKTSQAKAVIPIPVVISCLEAGFTQHEIACHIGVHHDTLRKRIAADPELAAVMENGLHLRRRALKLLQWNKAKQGNVPMLIHLGKAELGQSENDRGGDRGGNTGWLVETRPTVSPEQWAEQYGPMRSPKTSEGE